MNINNSETFFDKVHRCSICNSVSVEDIETNLGDFSPNMSFVPDPKDKNQLICIECLDGVQSVRDDFAFWDSLKNDEEEFFLVLESEETEEKKDDGHYRE